MTNINPLDCNDFIYGVTMAGKSRPKISVYIATSIDGYIASKDGGLNWLTKFNPPPENPHEDYGFKYFLSTIDALVMGKNTYQVVTCVDVWPYLGKRVIVLSSTLPSVIPQAEQFSGNLAYLFEKLHSEGIKHVYIDGGETISQCLNLKLIDLITITIVPVILGSGIPLFKEIKYESWYQLLNAKAYSNGLVQLQYELI